MSTNTSIISSGIKAKQRWKLLARALSGTPLKDLCQSSVSVRRFTSFALFDITPVTSCTCATDKEQNTPVQALWFLYKITLDEDLSYCAFIRQFNNCINAESLLGFNNTGNVCIWVAEEVMAYYCLKNISLFRQKTICELGGGMTCLAGICLSIASERSDLLLSDGNEASVANLSYIIAENQANFKATSVKSRLLRWGSGNEHDDLAKRFNVILCADCLFFDDGRQDLVDMIHELLSEKGHAIIFAPRRGHTFNDFCSLAIQRFDVEVTEQYDDQIWERHIKWKSRTDGMYDPDLHYPVMVTLSKR